MKYVCIILILFFSVSCLPQKNTDRILINNFESILGNLEKIYLDEIVNDFEKYLDSNYTKTDLESKYQIYLEELSRNKLKVPWKIDSLKMLKYLNSNLFAKYDTIYPDSVWYENEMVNVKFYEHEINDYSIIPIRRSNIPLDIDSIISQYKKKPNLIQTELSSFYMALDSIKSSNAFVQSFLYGINQPYWYPNFKLARGLLSNKPDFSNYFVKRIVAISTIKN